MKKFLSLILLFFCIATFSQSAAGVQESVLKNGIKVYTKTLPHSKITTVYIVLKDTMSKVTPSTSGICDMTMQLMQMASKKYSYDDLRRYWHDTQTTFSTYSSQFGSVYGLTTLTKYFDGSIERLLDTLLSPKFSDDDYKLLSAEISQDVQSRENDGVSILVDAVQEDFYKGTQFESLPKVTSKSMLNLTLDVLKNFYSTLLSPKNMAVVAVGNIPNNLTNNLATIGNIAQTPAAENILTDSAITSSNSTGIGRNNDWPGDSTPVIIVNESVGSAAYIIRAFRAPAINSDDYIACRIAAMIYDDVLFNVVRENKGVCYSAESFTTGGQINFGVELLYRATNYKSFASALNESRAIMAQGHVIKSHDKNGYKYESIDDRLPAYLNKYVNQKYEGQDTSAGVASRLCAGLLQFNDIAASDKFTSSAQNLKASDIIKVFNDYWCNGTYKWYAIADSNTCKKLKF